MTIRKWMAAAAMVLSGCAPALKNPQGISLTQGAILHTAAPRAIRANCRATLTRSGKTFRFDAWIECDSLQGRLDAMGPFNTPLASIVWTDTSWKTWLPGQGTLLRGTGPTMNLPVLDLRNIRPSLLVAPLLGRTTEVKGPVHVLAPTKGQVAVMPASDDPGWALLLDQSTGLPLRRQALTQGRETEGLAFFGWKSRNGVLVPGLIIRTTPDGQILELEVREWERLDSIPRAHTELHVPKVADTISIGQKEDGRKVFRIRASGGDTALIVLPHGNVGPADLDAVSDSATEVDTVGTDGTNVDDTAAEDDNLPAKPVAKPTLKGPGKL